MQKVQEVSTRVVEKLMCEYNVIMSVKKWDSFPNLIAVLENAV